MYVTGGDMITKLTLRVNSLLIQEAKAYAKQHNKSVSQIVGDYFSVLNNLIKPSSTQSLPLTKSLKGVLKNSKVSEDDYLQHLHEKYL